MKLVKPLNKGLSEHKRYNYTFLNFFLLFSLAIVIVQFVKLLTVYFCAKFIGLNEVYLTPYYVLYSAEGFKEWGRMNVVVLYGLPSLLMLFYSLVFWFLYRKTPTQSNVALKYLFFAIMVNAFAFFVSDFLITPFYHTGFKVVLQWFYINENWMIPLSIFSIMLIPLAVLLNAKQIIRFANSSKFIKNRSTKVSFIISYLLASSLAAEMCFLLLYALGSNFHVNNIFFVQQTMVLVIVVLFFGLAAFLNYSNKYIGISSNKDLQLFYPSILAAFVLFILMIALVLFFEVKF